MGDETNVVVGRMLQRRRRMRVPIIIGSVVTAAFAAFMVLHFRGSGRGELQVDGPVYSGKSHFDDDVPPPTAAAAPAAAEAGGAPAQVEVVTGHGAVLQVDGKQRPTHGRLDLELTAGRHLLVVQQGGRTYVQKMTLNVGDRFRVEFKDKVAVTKR